MEQLHQPGETVAERYRIVTSLGQGAFGNTYEAEDLTNHKCVAIKAISLTQIKDWKVIELFEREAKVLANLDHPAIPKYLDYFELNTPQDKRFYIVQDLVPGESLATLIDKDWRADQWEIVGIAKQILEILDYLHSLTPPVIHRDIKPQNIIRSPKGKIFLVDFGAVQDIYRHTLTQSNTFVGTLDYMPPEQLRGQVEAASDLYSLGATLLFLLTGRSPGEFPQRRLKLDFRRWLRVSAQLMNWLEVLLEPSLEDRFSSAQEALAGLGKMQLTPRSVGSIYPKPAATRITLAKTNRRVVIQLPAPKGSLLLFSLIWNVFILSLVIGSLWGGTTPFLITLLLLSPWLIVGWFTLKAALSATCLEIDRQKFRLRWSIGKFIHRSVQGQTDDIEQIELEVNRGSKGRTATSCIIWEGVHKRRFGSQTRKENEWLVAELSHFLTALRAGNGK